MAYKFSPKTVEPVVAIPTPASTNHPVLHKRQSAKARAADISTTTIVYDTPLTESFNYTILPIKNGAGGWDGYPTPTATTTPVAVITSVLIGTTVPGVTISKPKASLPTAVDAPVSAPADQPNPEPSSRPLDGTDNSNQNPPLNAIPLAGSSTGPRTTGRAPSAISSSVPPPGVPGVEGGAGSVDGAGSGVDDGGSAAVASEKAGLSNVAIAAIASVLIIGALIGTILFLNHRYRKRRYGGLGFGRDRLWTRQDDGDFSEAQHRPLPSPEWRQPRLSFSTFADSPHNSLDSGARIPDFSNSNPFNPFLSEAERAAAAIRSSPVPEVVRYSTSSSNRSSLYSQADSNGSSDGGIPAMDESSPLARQLSRRSLRTDGYSTKASSSRLSGYSTFSQRNTATPTSTRSSRILSDLKPPDIIISSPTSPSGPNPFRYPTLPTPSQDSSEYYDNYYAPSQLDFPVPPSTVPSRARSGSLRSPKYPLPPLPPVPTSPPPIPPGHLAYDDDPFLDPFAASPQTQGLRFS